MPDPTDKRAAAIEALVAVSHGEPPHTPTTMRRATAAIDALAAYLRAPEAEDKAADAPSEEGEGPEVWVEIDRHGKPAQVNDRKPGYGWEHDPKGRAVRYVPASSLQAAERRIAELEGEGPEVFGTISEEQAQARIASLLARTEQLTRRADANERRIAELEAERDRLSSERDTAIEQARYLVNAHTRAADERDTAVKRAEEAEAKLSDATAALKKAGEAIDILRKGPLVLR